MRRSILSVVATLLAFLAGVGVNRLIWDRSEKSPPPVPQIKAVATGATVAEPVVPVITPVETLQEGRIILAYNEEKFSPDGSYYIIGKTPKEFAEFEGFAIGYYEENTGAGVGDISVITKAGETYENVPAIFGFVTERRVVFLTSPHLKTDIEYLFDGEFIGDDLDALVSDKAVLRGTLTKRRLGRKLAEHVVSFRIELHEC